MKRYAQSPLSLFILGMIMLMPMVARADDMTTLIKGLMGDGSGGCGAGDSVTGCPNTVIGLLKKILGQSQNNGGVDNDGKLLQTQTDIKRSTYQVQQDWDRERRLRDDEITRSYPELSNLSCAIATANKSVPAIEVAADNATGDVIDILANGMYANVFLNTEISAKKKAQIWCKLGTVGKKGDCDVAADPLVDGGDRSRHAAYLRKVSIPCDMNAVKQEFQQMSNDGWTPNPKHKECIVAILSIANEFQISNSLPTKEELTSLEGQRIRDEKINRIAQAWASKGSALQQFSDRVSVSKSSLSNCDDGLKGGGEDVYALLEQLYQGTSRSTKIAPFGLPPSDFCLSKRLIRKGKELLVTRYEQTGQGNDNMVTLLQNIRAINTEQLRTKNQDMVAILDSEVGDGSKDIPSDVPGHKVSSNDGQNQELISAIRQLTLAVQQINTGVYEKPAQEVRLKKGAKPVTVTPAIEEKSAEITDALKDMGLKVSSPASGVLGPIKQEFPALPPQ